MANRDIVKAIAEHARGLLRWVPYLTFSERRRLAAALHEIADAIEQDDEVVEPRHLLM